MACVKAASVSTVLGKGNGEPKCAVIFSLPQRSSSRRTPTRTCTLSPRSQQFFSGRINLANFFIISANKIYWDHPSYWLGFYTDFSHVTLISLQTSLLLFLYSQTLGAGQYASQANFCLLSHPCFLRPEEMQSWQALLKSKHRLLQRWMWKPCGVQQTEIINLGTSMLVLSPLT